MKLKSSTALASNNISRRWFSRFRKDESGAIVVFSLFMFMLILWLAGMSVDLMRYEVTRAKLQATLDRATLSAADLDQTLECEEVVRDYFEKASMTPFLQSLNCDEGENFRTVNATAAAPMPLFFYDIPRIVTHPFQPGLTVLNVNGVSTAEERIGNVEISLVLDVSGSMNTNNRLTNLIPAAENFVTTLLGEAADQPADTSDNLITISIVPYNATVNPGVDIAAGFNVAQTHDESTCLLFEDAIFNTTALDLSATYEHVAHFEFSNANRNSKITNPWCRAHTAEGTVPDDLNSILPITSDVSDLHDAINDLVAGGNTAIDMGMKWGAALLDPSTQALFSAGGPAATPTTVDHPLAYNTADGVQKVIVLMTDGENTQQFDLTDRFKNDLSFAWFDLSDYPLTQRQLFQIADDDISIQFSGQLTPTDYTDDAFFWNGSNPDVVRSYPRGYDTAQEYIDDMETYDLNNGGIRVAGSTGVGITFDADVRQASWQELNANWPFVRVNNELFNEARLAGVLPLNAGTGTTTEGNVIFLPDFNDSDGRSGHNNPQHATNERLVIGSEANTRLSEICEAARDQNVIIFAVSFEAPAPGQAALQDCVDAAKFPGRFFDAQGTEINTAFDLIASSISSLRLTE